MRHCLLAAALAALLAAPAVGAAEVKEDKGAKGESKRGCHIELDKGDVMVERTDLVLQAGQTVKDAFALHGDVVVRKGAVVENVIAFEGDVTVEAGAEVKGDVVALGGELRLQDGATVRGNAISIGGKLKQAEGSSVKGDKLSIGSFEVNGTDLVDSLMGKVAKELRDCRVTMEDAEARAP
jgi:hypothetical protein